MMGLLQREEIARQLLGEGWAPTTPAAVVCGASTGLEWRWTGTLGTLGAACPPPGTAGVVVVGEVVSVGEALRQARSGATTGTDEVRYGRS